MTTTKGRASLYLRKIEGGYVHWCPACEEMHRLPDSWTFDGNLEQPTYSPSFKHSGKWRETINGQWTGEYHRDAKGEPLPWCCHYILTAGVLNYCGDCTHAMAGKSVPLPDLPAVLQDN